MANPDIEGILGEELRVAREAYESARNLKGTASSRDALNAYALALRRFSAFIHEGAVPANLEDVTKRDAVRATSSSSPRKADDPAA